MAKKNKLWFSGEDAQLAARFTKFMTKVLYARRASYIRALMVKAKHEISIEECRDEVDTVYRRLMNPIEESVESKLMWEGIKKYLHKLTPKECEVMISLYVDHLSVRETAAKLKVDDSTVSTSQECPRQDSQCDGGINTMEGFKDLLLRAKRGDEDAVEKLFVRYESLLNKCSRVNGRVDEDLYQVLLIEFWRAISEFKV